MEILLLPNSRLRVLCVCAALTTCVHPQSMAWQGLFSLVPQLDVGRAHSILTSTTDLKTTVMQPASAAAEPEARKFRLTRAIVFVLIQIH